MKSPSIGHQNGFAIGASASASLLLSLGIIQGSGFRVSGFGRRFNVRGLGFTYSIHCSSFLVTQLDIVGS